LKQTDNSAAWQSSRGLKRRFNGDHGHNRMILVQLPPSSAIISAWWFRTSRIKEATGKVGNGQITPKWVRIRPKCSTTVAFSWQ